METVDISSAKTRLSQLVDKAAAGEDVVVSRNGKPLVRITRLAGLKRRIKFGLLKGKPSRMIGQRNGDGCAVLAEEFFPASVGVETEKINGVLLALRPLALAADIGADCRQSGEAAAGDQGLDKDDNDEWPDEPEKTGAGVCLRKLHRASMEIAMTPVNLPAG